MSSARARHCIAVLSRNHTRRVPLEGDHDADLPRLHHVSMWVSRVLYLGRLACVSGCVMRDEIVSVATHQSHSSIAVLTSYRPRIGEWLMRVVCLS